MNVWKQHGKSDILETIERLKPVWAGDIIISSASGAVISICPFLSREGELYTCTIYEDRPSVCREYIPGSSALCSQYKYSK